MTERRDDAELSDAELTAADLTAADLTEFRARLRTDRSALQAECDAAMAELDKLRKAADESVESVFQREQQQAIASSRHTLLAQTEHALERIDAGGYGRCERCGGPIPKTRLTMLPMATLDGRCASIRHGE